MFFTSRIVGVLKESFTTLQAPAKVAERFAAGLKRLQPDLQGAVLSLQFKLQHRMMKNIQSALRLDEV